MDVALSVELKQLYDNANSNASLGRFDMSRFIMARPEQLLIDHLIFVSENCGRYASSVGLEKMGMFIGLLHDLGKCSSEFQKKIELRSKDRLDHSTAGARFVFECRLEVKNMLMRELGLGEQRATNYALAFCQIASLCIASHHSGMMDCLSLIGEPVFNERMNRGDKNCRFYNLILGENFCQQLQKGLLAAAKEFYLKIKETNDPSSLHFELGLYTRFLLSCLIDADRNDAAQKEVRKCADWGEASSFIDSIVKSGEIFTEEKNDFFAFRQELSEMCREKSELAAGVFYINSPTGSGKTLSSLRFALAHARKNGLKRIFFVLPFTTIIEQNAKIVRAIFEKSGLSVKIIEHHSNVSDEIFNSDSKFVENWDADIIFTTNVQFLNSFYSAGAGNARRLHNLSNSVIIFDEPQCLPVKTIHLFNRAVNFLVGKAGSTAVFCTATPPILDSVDRSHGAIEKEGNVIISPQSTIASRAKIKLLLGKVYDSNSIANILVNKNARSSLFIANTKKSALSVYKSVLGKKNIEAFYLSTDMCPAHRLLVLATVKEKLNNLKSCNENKKIVLVSTQLIEAGVHISFQRVVRSLCGVDSLVQSLGRCNRSFEYGENGGDFIILEAHENLIKLPEIRKSKEIALRVLSENKNNKNLCEKTVKTFFDYYWFERASEMLYKFKTDSRWFNMVEALGKNPHVGRPSSAECFLFQPFRSVNKIFNPIDSPTHPIIVPFDEDAVRLIDDLLNGFVKMRSLQKYCVNSYKFDSLQEMGAVTPLLVNDNTFWLLKREFYSNETGIGS